jgi:hypothetical protein
MKQNVGGIDRLIRLFGGIALVMIGTIGINNPIVGVIGLVVMGTGVFRFCTLYSLLGINTACKIEKKEEEKKEGE